MIVLATGFLPMPLMASPPFGRSTVRNETKKDSCREPGYCVFCGALFSGKIRFLHLVAYTITTSQIDYFLYYPVIGILVKHSDVSKFITYFTRASVA
jgi:hypothetical protein